MKIPVLYLIFLPLLTTAQSINPAPSPTVSQHVDSIAVPDSKVSLPVDVPIDFSALEQAACDYYEGSYKGNDAVIYVECDYKLWRDKKFEELRLHDDIFSISSKIYYYLLVHSPLECQCGWNDKNGSLEMTVGFDSKIVFDDNLNITTHTTFRPITNNEPCLICRFNANVTKVANSVMTKKAQGYADIFDQMVSRYSAIVAGNNQTVFTAIKAPIVIDSSTKIQLNPMGVASTPFRSDPNEAGDVHHFKTDIQIGLRPAIENGAGTPMAHLVSHKPAPESAETNVVNLLDQEVLTYDQFSEALMKGLMASGQMAYVDNRRKATVETASFYPNEGNVVIKLAVTLRPVQAKRGFFHKIVYLLERVFYHRYGYVYLSGTPKYERTGRFLDIPDLHFTDETKAILNEKAPWLDSPDFVSRIKENSKVSLDSKITVIQTALSKNLNTTPSSHVRFLFGNQQAVSLRIDNITSGLLVNLLLNGNFRVVIQ